MPNPFGTILGQLADGVPLLIAIDALTFFIAAATLPFLHVPSPSSVGKRKESLWVEAKEGMTYIWSYKPLLWLLGIFAIANLGVPIDMFEVLVVKLNLAPDWSARGLNYETALALVTSMAGLGGGMAGLLMSTWGGFKTRRVYAVLGALIANGLAQVVFGLSQVLYLSAVMAFVIAGTNPIMGAHARAILQSRVPLDLQGRVFAADELIAQATLPVGIALWGWAGGLFNPGAVMAVGGSLLALVCVAQLFNHRLLRVGNKDLAQPDKRNKQLEKV